MPLRSRRVATFAAGAALATITPHARAIVSAGAPMPRPENGFIGSWNGSSAVPIAPRWVLSAQHVGGVPNVTFSMQGFSYVADLVVRHPTDDLQLIRVSSDLPGWHGVATLPTPITGNTSSPTTNPRLETGALVANTAVVLAGMGRTNGVPIPGGGWDWTGPARETWGENILVGVFNSLLGARFDLNAPESLSYEASYALNDSGGGMFLPFADGSLRLIGVAVGTSPFGRTIPGSMAYALNLAPFIPWIESVVGSSVLGPGSTPSPGGALLLSLAGLCFAARRRR